jgi:hypothetical protein
MSLELSNVRRYAVTMDGDEKTASLVNDLLARQLASGGSSQTPGQRPGEPFCRLISRSLLPNPLHFSLAKD